MKSVTCKTDLKARPHVAERAARKPIKLNRGSPPVAITIPAMSKNSISKAMRGFAPSVKTSAMLGSDKDGPLIS